MKTVAIACKTLEEEVKLVLRRIERPKPELIWVESGLHNTPEKLRARLQLELDGLREVGRVLLIFGICGNSALYLRSRDFEIILPRVDDCITLMLGSFYERRKISSEVGTYFLTRGWLRNESNIYSDYQYALKKYGKRITEEIYKTLLAHYIQLGLIDTGAYDFEEFLKETKIISTTLGLTQRPIKGTLSYLEQLLTGPWPEIAFVTVPKYHEITSSMLDISQCR